jgi:glycosyltransferase involved in cell wall biosynthesis
MRVALDVSAVPSSVAGAGRYVVELARRLPSAVEETTLVARRGDAERWREYSPDARVVSLVPSSRAERLLYEAWRLGKSSVARHVDVWHSPHYTMPHRCVAPTVVTIHDMTMFTNPEWHERSKVAFFRRAIAYSARHAKTLVSVSEFTARQLDELVPVHAPVIVAPHGVDLEAFTPHATDDEEMFLRSGLVLDVPYIFFLGTVEPRKGLDVLLDAFAQLILTDDTTELWIAGQVGWAMNGFDETLARHPGAARIHRLGFVDEGLVAPLLRRSSVVVYPSRGEGFGLPVLEAMACGSLVVTTFNTVMAEVGGDAVSLTPAGDASELAYELGLALALDDDQLTNRSIAARARAEQFPWSRTVDQHLKAYEMARAL